MIEISAESGFRLETTYLLHQSTFRDLDFSSFAVQIAASTAQIIFHGTQIGIGGRFYLAMCLLKKPVISAKTSLFSGALSSRR